MERRRSAAYLICALLQISAIAHMKNKPPLFIRSFYQTALNFPSESTLSEAYLRFAVVAA